MKIADLQSLTSSDIAQMNTEQLRGIIDTAGKYANKRLERLEEKYGEKSATPAAAYIEKTGGEFTAEGKNRNQMITEVIRLKGFTEAKTSTITGANKVLKDFYKRMETKEPQDIDKIKDFWKEYRNYAEHHPNRVSSRQDSTAAQRQLYDTMFPKKPEDEEKKPKKSKEIETDEAIANFAKKEIARYQEQRAKEIENIKERAVKNGNISKFFNNTRNK